MLLHRLVDYARADPHITPPFYASKPVRWVVELNPDGSLASRHLTDLADPGDRAQRDGMPRMVPSVQRSGIASQPMLAVDTAEYALGRATDGKRDAKAEQYHATFRELVARWHANSDDPAAAALHHFLTEGHAARLLKEPNLAGNHLVAFRGSGRFLHDTDSARQFWASEAGKRKSSTRTGLCLVCAQVGPLLKTIPQQLPKRLVPGASQTAALVSLNKPTHVYALQEQLEHTPICPACGLQMMNALEVLLSGASSTRFPGQDTRLTWWTSDRSAFDLDALDDPSPARVAALLGSATRGMLSGDEDLAMFCAVMVGGNIARVVVREWIELPLPRLIENLQRWFDDHEMVEVWSGEVCRLRISRLVSASGRWIAGRGQEHGRYAKWGASGADRPDDLYQALMGSALGGKSKPLPPKLLTHLVHRIRTDQRVDTERAALIRLALRRRHGNANPEAYMPTLNPRNHHPAYLSGRIFAVLERLQQTAAWARGDKELNVSFADRYFARAVTSPAVALVAGQRDAQSWLKRLRRDRPGSAKYYDNLLEELFACLAEAGGIPHGAVLADQAAFILGYHQQRADMRKKQDAAATDAADTITTDPATTDLDDLEGAPA
ncbi:MAG: type I-C CRISPR-associated protein Cas8c/Csd1 [Pseudonocardiaceae bacterium]